MRRSSGKPKLPPLPSRKWRNKTCEELGLAAKRPAPNLVLLQTIHCNYMGARSFFAFRFTMEHLIDQNPDMEMYFWTFTFREVLDVDVAAKRWSSFLGSVNNTRQPCLLAAFPLLSGIRVFEMHPGTASKPSHGLHVHMICDRWLPVDIVRSLWHKHAGEGSRLQADKVGPGRAFYIGKYLNKSGRSAALNGFRLWAAFGLAAAERTRCKDIVIENAWTQSYAYLAAAVKGFADLPWPTRLRMAKEFSMGENFEANLERYGYKLEEEFPPGGPGL